jgi:hypothetical protein
MMTKADMINAILRAMRAAYEKEGIEGDFADAYRYYRDEASLDELLADYEKWCC